MFTVDDDGAAVGPTVVRSAGQTPFGFAFGKRNEVFVSDAFGGAANAGAVSSYVVSDKQNLTTITAAAVDGQTAPCWVVLTNDGRFAYTTNTGSGNISGYRVGFNGTLQLLSASGQTGNTGTGSTPLDAAISNDSRFPIRSYARNRQHPGLHCLSGRLSESVVAGDGCPIVRQRLGGEITTGKGEADNAQQRSG